jgi:hypothetical protein
MLRISKLAIGLYSPDSELNNFIDESKKRRSKIEKQIHLNTHNNELGKDEYQQAVLMF